MLESGSGTSFEVSYGDGWDPGTRSIVRPITMEQARSRDVIGEPYTVVLIAPGTENSAAILHVAWNHHYLGLWWFDEFGRRDREADLRSLETGKLFLRHLAQWRYDGPEVPEFSDTTWHQTIDLYPNGKGSQVVEPEGRLGGSTHTVPSIPLDQRWLPRPVFGCWEDLLNAPPLGSHGTYRIRPADRPDPAELSVGAAQPFGWHPPTPASEPRLNALFTPGSLFTHEHGPNPVAIEPIRTLSTYTVTDGLVAICDPAYLRYGWEGNPLVVEVPPGTYPLQETGVSYPGEMFGETFTARDVYAIRLLISPTPTVSWTMAVPPGDDVRLLRNGEGFGFPVDSGSGCFVDVERRHILGQRFLDGEFSPNEDYPDAAEPGFPKITDQTTGAEILSFPTGDGAFIVWIGHDLTGNVTALVIPAPLELIGVEPFPAESTQ